MSSKVGGRTVVTVAQLGGHWGGIQVNPNDSKSAVTTMLTDKKAAEAAAKLFAKEHGFLYLENHLTFDQPIVTIWRTLGHWVPAKIFDDRIAGAGRIWPTKEEAKREAEWVAARDGLMYAPSIGEEAFPGVV